MTTRTRTTRRDQLTAIAAGLFARDGYHNVTVGDIAAAAGLSGPAIYRHFPGKQALLAEVVRTGFDDMAGAVTADLAATDPADPADRLRTTYQALAAFVIRRPEFGVMWRREHRHLAPADAADLAKRMSEASDAAVLEIHRLRPGLPAADTELLSWAALSVLGSISDHRARLPRAAFEELLAGIAMNVVSADLGEGCEDNRPPESEEGDRRERILAAAAQMFRDRGYHAVTLEEIGAAAGIAGPSIYSHFAGKTDLLRTITERIGERLRLTVGDQRAWDDAGGADGSAAGSGADSAYGSAADRSEVGASTTRSNIETGADSRAADHAETGAESSTATTAQAALSALAARYIATVLASRDLVAAYFTEGHNLPDRDRADTRRFQRAYAAHWAALLSQAVPGISAEEVRIRVLAAFAVVNDTVRTRRLAEQSGLGGRLRALVAAVLLTPVGGVRDVNRR